MKKYLKRNVVSFMSVRNVLGIAALALSGAAFTSVLPAQVLSNGDLETWSSVSGTPPAGTPDGWSAGGSANLPYRTEGLTAGSTYSAFLRPGASDILAQDSAVSGLVDYTVSFDMAALDPGSASARSFNLTLAQGTISNNVINLRTVQGSSSGLLTLQAYDGSSGWTTLAADAFQASVYDGGTNTFSTLNSYVLMVTTDFADGSYDYSVSYGPEGGSTTTISGITAFQNTPTSTDDLTRLAFVSSGSSVGYAVDNVSVVAVPEHASASLMFGSSLLLLLTFKRVRALAWRK